MSGNMFRDFFRMVNRLPALASLCLALIVAAGCSNDKKPTNAPPAAPANDTSAMFRTMEQKGGLPPPPVEETKAGDTEEVPDIPELLFEKSPECKALEADQKKVRDEIDRLNKELVGPAAAKAEQASDAFDECQDDIGCVNNLDRYEARHRAYQNARKALRDAERKVEALETQLYNISQKIAAKCDTSPL